MIEIHNPPWATVKAKLEADLAGLRSRLENTSLEYGDTQVLRGEIRALKRILDLPQTLAEARKTEAPFLA